MRCWRIWRLEDLDGELEMGEGADGKVRARRMMEGRG